MNDEDMFEQQTVESLDDSDQQGPVMSQHQRKREKEYGSWEKIREKILNGRIETEGFFGKHKCCECGHDKVDVRCMECGIDQYFCLTCAQKIHGERNYFHVLEKLKACVIHLLLCK